MTRLFVLVIAVVLANYASAQIMPVLLQNGKLTELAPEVNTRFASFSSDFYSPGLRFWKDLIIYLGPTTTELGILKKNSTGGYDLKTAFDLEAQLYYFADLDVHEGWVAVSYFVYAEANKTSLILFQLDENGVISNVQRPDVPDFNFEHARFISDGSLVGVSRLFNAIPKPAALIRFQLVNGNWTKTDSFTFSRKLETTFPFQVWIQQRKSVFHLSNTHFIASDKAQIHVYERATDLSWTWTLAHSIPLAVWPSDISWNGGDTIVVGVSTEDKIFMITKLENGTWVLQSTATTATFGIQIEATQLLGYAAMPLNSDTFLVSSAYWYDDAFPDGESDRGKVIVLQRLRQEWTAVAMISGTVRQSFFGASFGVTDTHILIDGRDSIQSIPRCLLDPVEFNCPAKASVDSCNSEISMEISFAVSLQSQNAPRSP